MILGHPSHGRCFEEIDAAVAALRGTSSAESGVMFNAHNFPAPPGSTVYNLENFEALRDPFAFAENEVWDFSERNVSLWPGAMRVRHVPLGYHPSMKRFTMRPVGKRNIDVAFFGAPHPRRKRLVNILRDHKLHVVYGLEAYGAERDAILAKTKLALNMQYFERGSYPTARALHLVSNGVPMVSETAAEMPAWAAFLPHAPYTKLAEKIVQLVRDPSALDVHARHALQRLQQSPLVLPPPLDAAIPTPTRAADPSTLARPTCVKLLVVVHIHNRFENLERWLACWKRIVLPLGVTVQLVVIQNEGVPTHARFHQRAIEAGAVFLLRKGRGYDIGAFQDICRRRLEGFSTDYDALLWCADDCLPMRPDFLAPFVDHLYRSGIGVACMTVSREYAEHVRTTGFCLRRTTAEALEFPVDPILSKDDCYAFEHRGGARTLLRQIQAQGLRAAVVGSVKTSPLWDSDYARRIDRSAEFQRAWTPSEPTPDPPAEPPPVATLTDPTVVFVCPIFDAFPEIISSLMCQTYDRWRLILIDDHPQRTTVNEWNPSHRTRALAQAAGDPRIKYVHRERSPNGGMWGHPHRKWALEELKQGHLAPEATHVIVTNADNYYLPPFLESLVDALKSQPGAVAAYGGKMLHKGSHEPKHLLIDCRLERGYLDCGGVMVEKAVACDVGWPSFDHSSDWTYFQEILGRHGGAGRWVKAEGLLFVHN